MEFEDFKTIPVKTKDSIPGYETFMRNHSYEELFPKPEGLKPRIIHAPKGSVLKQVGQRVNFMLRLFTPVL
jgi:hypothetical protein